MKRARRAATVAVAIAVCATPTVASAFPDFLGPRGLAMGGAGRADARAGEAVLLNPAGMSLGRSYSVEGAYQYISRDGGHLGHVSIVDSTSGFNLSGGVFYSYRTASPVEGGKVTGHQPGLALSFPFGGKLLVGVSGKYLHVAGGPSEADGSNAHSGFTADVGAAIRAGTLLTLGVTGYNLRDLSTAYAPVMLGYGVAVNPLPDLVVAVDALHDFTTSEPARGVATSFGAGAEYGFQQRLVFRLGGGRDGGLKHGFLSAGLVALSEVGAVDLGVRQDISGASKLTFIALGLRLFVPQP